MVYVNKVFSFVLILFFICGLFTAGVSSVFASGLVAGSWNAKASMPQARAGLGVVAVDGKIYAIGGYTSFDDGRPVGFVGTNERYDPITDKWVILESMPTPRHNFAVVECEGLIYCIGGYVVEGSRWILYDTVEVYDPATNRWSAKASLPVTASDLVACVVKDNIFVFATSAAGVVYMYNPITDSWTEKTRMPSTTLMYYAPVVMDDKILFTSLYLSTQVYDPAADAWREIEKESHLTLIFTRILTSDKTTGVYTRQGIYVLGRQYSAQRYVANWFYDPVNDTAISCRSLPSYREDFGIAVVDDLLYVMGGSVYSNTESKVLAINEQYVPVDYYGASEALGPHSFQSINPAGLLLLISAIVNTFLIIILTAIAGIIGIVIIIVAILFKKKKTNRKVIR